MIVLRVFTLRRPILAAPQLKRVPSEKRRHGSTAAGGWVPSEDAAGSWSWREGHSWS